MKSAAEFDSYYQSHLLPVLESLESERKSTVAAFWSAIVSLLFFIPVIILAVGFENPWLLILGFAPLFFTVKKLSQYSNAKKIYVQHFKEKVIRSIVKMLDEQLDYFPDDMITQSEYREADLFRNRMDEYSGGDLVNGKIGSTALKFSELLHREKRVTTDGRGHTQTQWVTIFRGIFFIADFNKNFSGRTFVLPDSGIDFLGIGKLLEKWFEGRGEPIALENPTFEKFFKVFGSNQIEARYILSPAVMERLIDFREKLSGRVYISFIDSKVFIAIPLSKNLFEPNEFSSGVKADYLKEYFFYLDLITGIVNDLNLNVRIWTKP